MPEQGLVGRIPDNLDDEWTYGRDNRCRWIVGILDVAPTNVLKKIVKLM
jgi:hypothetical protein